MEAAYMIEEGYAVPAMLATGLPETVASAMWAVGPLLGVFFQGYLGSASDRCTCAWGKRRPFIVCLAVCACLATLLFPYGSFVSGTVLCLSEKSGGIFVMVFTAFTFVSMDFFLDSLQSPLRAYLIDSVPTERSEQANYMFTALLCVGAIVGSLIAGIPWSSKSDGNGKLQMEVVFGIATLIFAVCTPLCLNSIHEKNPTTHESPSIEKVLSLPLAVKRKTACLANDRSPTTLSAKLQSQSMSREDLNHKLTPQTKITNGVHFVSTSRAPSQLPRLKTTPTHIPTYNSCLSRFFGDVYCDLCDTILFSKYMSPHFSQLCLTVFFNWVSCLSLQLFFTSFMGQVVYGGSPHAPSGDKERKLFDHGVRIGFLVMLLADVVSTINCLSMKWLSDCLGIRQLFIGGLGTYVVVCLVTAMWPTLPNAVLLQAVAGLVYSNNQSLPYTLIAHYEVKLLLAITFKAVQDG